MDFQFLRDCVKSLKESPDNGNCFYMGTWLTEFPRANNGWCGTPACVLGHYAHRKSLEVPGPERLYKVQEMIMGASFVPRGGVSRIGGLTLDQVGELFSVEGCGGAPTVERAIAYMERFIVRHGGSLEDPKRPKPLDICVVPDWQQISQVPSKELACPLT